MPRTGAPSTARRRASGAPALMKLKMNVVERGISDTFSGRLTRSRVHPESQILQVPEIRLTKPGTHPPKAKAKSLLTRVIV